MNATVVDDAVPYTTDTGKPAKRGDAYIFVVGFFCIFVLLISFTYASYICKKSRSQQPTTISFDTIYNEDIENRHHHLMSRFSDRGLDDNVLVTFPMFLYSDATMPHKDECSICLADYKPADVVRLLPECGHLFHVKCIDTWLKAHPTCPVCRNTPIAMP
uniref:RING-H2 finger protein ATL70-like n=1 Tax=Erigeron canadensis TaxID=72917 RepID=UPI001CB9A3FF|nr:RING-H2 finger protein ATL70-like [Erigeron canadensis]